MTRDFTLMAYRDLMETVTDSVYTPTTVCDYLTSPPARAMILRHDVDRAPERALDMARVEDEMGVRVIRETYQFNRGVSE